MRDTIYVVTMYRWGCTENHSYIVGAFNKHSDALLAAENNEKYRECKYRADIAELKIDIDYTEQIEKINHYNFDRAICSNCQSEVCSKRWWIK
jgi:hypothetical protein